MNFFTKLFKSVDQIRARAIASAALDDVIGFVIAAEASALSGKEKFAQVWAKCKPIIAEFGTAAVVFAIEIAVKGIKKKISDA